VSSKRPHPAEEDLAALVQSMAEAFEAEIRQHPEPEYWILKAADRLDRFIKMKAPPLILEQARQVLVRHVNALPPYADLKKESTE
jgi:hypothetical protein